AHNPKVVGSNPAPATNMRRGLRAIQKAPVQGLFVRWPSAARSRRQNGPQAHFFVVETDLSVGTRQGKLLNILQPVVTALGYELWGIEFIGTGKHSTLRIYIDKPEGILVEDCERVSRQASSVLDVEDPIQGEYTLEVSSPGMDRPLYNLDQYTLYLGEEVSVRLRIPYEGRRKYKGRLVGVEGDEIVMQV